MHPRLFGFVKSYGLMLAISFLVGTLLSIRRGRTRGKCFLVPFYMRQP